VFLRAERVANFDRTERFRAITKRPCTKIARPEAYVVIFAYGGTIDRWSVLAAKFSKQTRCSKNRPERSYRDRRNNIRRSLLQKKNATKTNASVIFGRRKFLFFYLE